MRLILRSLSLLAILAASTLAAHADSFSYAFMGFNSNDYFTYISPTLITTTTTFTPLTCHAFDASCSEVMFGFDPSNAAHPATITSYLIPVGSVTYEFTSAAFLTTLGTNTAPGGVTLTITDIPSPPSVPEPSTLALLGTGVLGLAGAIRRKFFNG